MKLHVGERLSGSGPPEQPGGYVVSGVLAETPWYGVYAARKVFYHFDFTARRPREADEREWLEVTLRTNHYPQLDDADQVAGRRALLRAEAQRVPPGAAGWAWPATLDLLDVENTRDPFTFPPLRGVVAREPVLVLERLDGAPLGRWRQEKPSAASVLHLLGDLLHLVNEAHAAGLVLQGLGPGTVQVDALGRPRFVATELAIELSRAASGSLDGLVPGAKLSWASFFPPERFPRGFAAPECFNPTAPRDRRTDLYGWAALAYFLLTGENLVHLAAAQGHPWAEIGDEQLNRLEQALRSVAPAHVGAWAEQLGLDTGALVQGWPRNFLSVMRLCLRPDPRLRPPSVADLCGWLLAPPPPPLTAVLALRPEGPLAAQLRTPSENGRVAARLFLDITELKQGQELSVRRAIGTAPATPDEGEPVADGPPRSWLDDARPLTASSVPHAVYAVFVRQRHGSAVSASPATVAELVPAAPAELLAYVETGAADLPANAPETPRVRLLFEALTRAAAAEVLFRSEMTQVRGWAIRRLAADVREPSGRALLFRALQDPAPALRLEAARALFEGAARPPVALVRQVLQGLGGGDRDEALRAARTLPTLGLAPDVVREAIASLKGDDLVVCPECKTALPAQERPTHLAAVHGYLDVSGILLPRPLGMTRLWDRVFAGDREAHARLAELLLDGTQGEAAYANALAQEIVTRGEGLATDRYQEVSRLVQCLRGALAARNAQRRLLDHADARVREVAREVVLPETAEQLASETTTADDVRKQLDFLCPREGPEEKIRLGRRLPQFSVSVTAVDECLRQLQQEVPIPCPECKAPVRRADLDAHLRQAHRIFQFRGQRRSLNETVSALLSAVLGASPDYEAWKMLQMIAQEQYGPGAAAFLAASLAQALGRLGEAARAGGIRAAAEAVVSGDLGPKLTTLLAAENAPMARRLALALAERLAVPLEEAVVRALLPLLLDRRLLAEEQITAAAALLRTTGRAGHASTEVLNALVAGQSKARAVERLRRLEQLAGTSPALDDLIARLEDQVRMQCPRCPVRLRRVDMVGHLWNEHKLILDGRKVREPWRAIEEWLDEYRADPRPELLERSRALALRVDPEDGRHRVYRLFLAHGVEDPEAQAALLDEAKKEEVSLCPHCYGHVPVPRPVPLPPMNRWHGRLSALGYRVEVSDGGLVTRLEAETPKFPIRTGPEPGRVLTQRGAILTLTSPLVGLALLLALVVPAEGFLFLTVLLVLMAASGAYLLAQSFWRPVRSSVDRALDYAWTTFVPYLHADGFSPEDSAFIASLALATLEQGRDKVPRGVFDVVDDLTEHAVARGLGVAEHLAALKRLAITQAAAAGQDPVPLVAAQVARCFDGRLPLSFAEALLDGWENDWWTRGNLARLRALLCDRAFEAGFEVRNLIESCVAAPALDAVLQTDDSRSLVQLRLLWSLRPRQPWERCGEARTVFELAQDVGSEPLLAKYPDLLLVQEFTALMLLDRNGEPQQHVQVLVTCRGVVFGGVLFGEPPRSIEVVTRRLRSEGIYELVLDAHKFRFRQDPEHLIARLERWFRYYFKEFVPESAGVHRWQSPNGAVALRAQQAVPCPECQRPVVTRLGEVGTPADGGEAVAETVVRE